MNTIGFSNRARNRSIRVAIVLLAAIAPAACAARPAAVRRPGVPPPEVRALWVVRTTLNHPDSIKVMVRRADENGFRCVRTAPAGSAASMEGRK